MLFILATDINNIIININNWFFSFWINVGLLLNVNVTKFIEFHILIYGFLFELNYSFLFGGFICLIIYIIIKIFLLIVDTVAYLLGYDDENVFEDIYAFIIVLLALREGYWLVFRSNYMPIKYVIGIIKMYFPVFRIYCINSYWFWLWFSILINCYLIKKDTERYNNFNVDQKIFLNFLYLISKTGIWYFIIKAFFIVKEYLLGGNSFVIYLSQVLDPDWLEYWPYIFVIIIADFIFYELDGEYDKAESQVPIIIHIFKLMFLTKQYELVIFVLFFYVVHKYLRKYSKTYKKYFF